jgi:hypothetical protein
LYNYTCNITLHSVLIFVIIPRIRKLNWGGGAAAEPREEKKKKEKKRRNASRTVVCNPESKELLGRNNSR